MSQLRLLKRLSHWQKSGKGGNTNEHWETALLQDIENLLNTQEGNALIDADLGMTDLKGQFQSHNSPDIESLQKQLQQQITLFETRLTGLELNFIDDNKDPTCFSWKLSASLINQLGSMPVMANIKLQANGQVTVESVV